MSIHFVSVRLHLSHASNCFHFHLSSRLEITIRVQVSQEHQCQRLVLSHEALLLKASELFLLGCSERGVVPHRMLKTLVPSVLPE